MAAAVSKGGGGWGSDEVMGVAAFYKMQNRNHKLRRLQRSHAGDVNEWIYIYIGSIQVLCLFLILDSFSLSKEICPSPHLSSNTLPSSGIFNFPTF